MSEPPTGQRALCTQCHQPIVYVGPYWDHPGEIKPRHIAIPGEWLETFKVEMELDLDAIERRLEAAREELSALCNGGKRWLMTIPANHETDSDLILGAVLRDTRKLLIAVRSLLEQKEG